jgi:hypothetical protein
MQDLQMLATCRPPGRLGGQDAFEPDLSDVYAVILLAARSLSKTFG